jgi:Tfp pilus assembly protein PilO
VDYTINIFSLIIILVLIILFGWSFYINKINRENLQILRTELQSSFASNQQVIQKLDTNVQNLQQNFDKELNKILHEIKSPLNLD